MPIEQEINIFICVFSLIFICLCLTKKTVIFSSCRVPLATKKFMPKVFQELVFNQDVSVHYQTRMESLMLVFVLDWVSLLTAHLRSARLLSLIMMVFQRFMRK